MIDTVKIKKSPFTLFPAVFSFAFAVCLIVFSDVSKTGAAEGLRICRDVILTSVFPFSAAASLLISSGAIGALGRITGGIVGRAFGVSDAGAGVILLGAVGGFPTGAYAASNLYLSGKLSKTEAEKLISYTNNPTPAFMVGYVGSLLGSAVIGVYCYTCILVSALLWGVLIRGKYKRSEGNAVVDTEFSFSSSVSKSVFSAVIICGFVIIFSVISNIVTVIGGGLVSSIICPLFEITSGVGLIFSYGLPLRMTASLLCAVCSFSGLCIYSQVKTETDSAGISVKYYIAGKTFQAVISFILSFALYPLFFV